MSKKILLEHAHIEGIRFYETYRKNGGYRSVEKALKMSPDEIVEEVKKSGLRGRGGAGFPTGMKWSFLAKPEGVPRHLVCNADESEPGTFKDRYLMEFLPHLLIEGLIVSSYALGSNATYIYIRGEYAWIPDILEQAIAEAKANGEKAPNFNLCDITIPGTNLYCGGNKGIPREQMPQFKGKPQPGSIADGLPKDKDGEVDTEAMFKKMLEDKGIKVSEPTQVPADQLKATQTELVGSKVAGMSKALDTDPNNPGITAPIYISSDGYVLDGHHRWAAVTSAA